MEKEHTSTLISLCCNEKEYAAFLAAGACIPNITFISGYSPDARIIIADGEGTRALPNACLHKALLFLLDVSDSLYTQQAEYMFQPPYGHEAILRHGLTLLGRPLSTPSRQLLAAQTGTFLQDLHLPSRLLGHGYLLEGVLMLFDQPYPGRPGLLQEIYAQIALQNNTSAVMVDRAIRHGVEVCWKKTPSDRLKSIFGYGSHDLLGTPTNGEFLYAVYEHVRARLTPSRGQVPFFTQLRAIHTRHVATKK